MEEQEEIREGYMCKVTFDHELGEALGGSRIYSSKEDLLAHHPMAKECGIVKVKITKVEDVE